MTALRSLRRGALAVVESARHLPKQPVQQREADGRLHRAANKGERGRSDHDPAWVTLVILAPLAELAAALRNGQRGRAMRRACNYRSVMSTVGRSVLPDHPAA